MTGAAAPLGMLVNAWPKLSETFILEEVLGLERQGVPLRRRVHAHGSQCEAQEHGSQCFPWCAFAHADKAAKG